MSVEAVRSARMTTSFASQTVIELENTGVVRPKRKNGFNIHTIDCAQTDSLGFPRARGYPVRDGLSTHTHSTTTRAQIQCLGDNVQSLFQEIVNELEDVNDTLTDMVPE